MREREQVKARRKPGSHPSEKDWKCLNEEHVLGPARCINTPHLRMHIAIDHGVSTNGCRTPAELGRLHLLIHAVLAHDDLRKLLDIDEMWGKG